MAKQTLFIIRGLPGAGKSTIAQKLREGYEAHGELLAITEADQFFMRSNGHKEVYEFDRRYLGAAHDECYGRSMRFLKKGRSVAVANTFSTRREIQRYVSGVRKMCPDVDVVVIHATGRYKSVHNVPQKSIDAMKARWERWDNEVKMQEFVQ